MGSNAALARDVRFPRTPNRVRPCNTAMVPLHRMTADAARQTLECCTTTRQLKTRGMMQQSAAYPRFIGSAAFGSNRVWVVLSLPLPNHTPAV